MLASVILFFGLKDGKIIYDIKFPLYYNNKERTYIINIEAQKSTRASKLGYGLDLKFIGGKIV